MSAAKQNIKATKPLEPYDGPGAIPQPRNEAALRATQAAEHVGRYVAFDHDGKRVVGQCVASEPSGKHAETGIPDFRVSVRSLRDENRSLRMQTVAQRCQFYDDLAEARRITEGLGK
jgi:hypothetical protein